MPNIWFTGRKMACIPNVMAIIPIEIFSIKQSYLLLYAFFLHILYSQMLYLLICTGKHTYRLCGVNRRQTAGKLQDGWPSLLYGEYTPTVPPVIQTQPPIILAWVTNQKWFSLHAFRKRNRIMHLRIKCGLFFQTFKIQRSIIAFTNII